MNKVILASWLLILFHMCILIHSQENDFSEKEGQTKLKQEKDVTNEIKKRTKREEDVTSVVDKLLQNYNKQQPPSLDKPTQLRIGIYVNSFYAINEQTMDYTISMYLRQSWQDPRLKFDPINGRIDTVRLGDGRWNDIWIPDTFFRNEKRAAFHSVTVPNTLLRLNSTGHLWYVTKISTTLSCPMKLQKYPFDTQMCPIMFESFGYTMDTVYFNWLDSPVDVDPVVQLPHYTLTDIILYDCSQNYTAGAFPCLEIRFVLERDIGYYITQLFIPSMFIVVISWMAFWIDITALTSRLAVGLIAMLIMALHNMTAPSPLPRVSYVKAVDIWTSCCVTLVFASLLESVAVNFTMRKKLTGKKIAMKLRSITNKVDKKDMEAGNQPDECEVDPAAKHLANRMDKMARIIFPVVFLLFNILYWILYQ